MKMSVITKMEKRKCVVKAGVTPREPSRDKGGSGCGRGAWLTFWFEEALNVTYLENKVIADVMSLKLRPHCKRGALDPLWLLSL